MIRITPGYVSRGIIYSIIETDNNLNKAYIRIPEMHGMSPTDTTLDSGSYTPDEQLPIATITGTEKYEAGDVVAVTFPTGDLNYILVTGLLMKGTDASNGFLSKLFGSISDLFGGIFDSSSVATSSSNAKANIKVDKAYLEYFEFPIRGSYVVTAEQGSDVKDSVHNGHTGTDISGCGTGAEVHAIGDGLIVKMVTGYTNTTRNKSGGYGNHIIISHGTINGKEIWSLYGHMLNNFPMINGKKICKNMSVKKGDVIGYVGSTGNSTGPHLHLEIRVGANLYGYDQNPRKFVPFP